MDFLTVLGFLVVIGGFIGLFMVIRKQRPPVETIAYARDISNASARGLLPSYRPRSVKDELKKAEFGTTVTLLGEPEREIKASINLFEMYQRTPESDWERTGNVSMAKFLAGDILILKVPSQEAGKEIWLKATELRSPSLMHFYKGSKEEPGPARIFKMKEQGEPVPYDLPNNLTPGISWKIIDIGTFDAEVKDECENIVDGDRLYFVSSLEQGGDRRLLYLDARKGEAQGSGGLFLAEPFEPTVDILHLM